jgi:hypothetical protein
MPAPLLEGEGQSTNTERSSTGAFSPQTLTCEKQAWLCFWLVTNCDAWTVFSFSLPLFIACTITVGHVTDDLYFRT